MARYNPRNQRLTIYDMMEQKGVFAKNPANIDSINDQGESIHVRQDFPKMFFHPEGKKRVLVPAEIIVTPLGPKAVGLQEELIWQLATNAEEEEGLRAEGWHDHPSKALRKAGEEIPLSPSERVEDLETQIKRLQLQLDEKNAQELAAQRQPTTGRPGGAAKSN